MLLPITAGCSHSVPSVRQELAQHVGDSTQLFLSAAFPRFSSPAPSFLLLPPMWAPPWATVPAGEYLLQWKLIHELHSLYRSICSRVGLPQAADLSRSTCFSMSSPTGHDAFREVLLQSWSSTDLRGCNQLCHGVSPTAVALSFPVVFTCLIALGVFCLFLDFSLQKHHKFLRFA